MKTDADALTLFNNLPVSVSRNEEVAAEREAATAAGGQGDCKISFL